MRAGICTEIGAHFKFECDVAWMKKYKVRGVVIGRRILFACSTDELPRWLFRHELEHAYQMMREGFLKFHIKYFYYAVRYGYDEHPYENEAREAQLLPLTEHEEHLLWILKGHSAHSIKE